MAHDPGQYRPATMSSRTALIKKVRLMRVSLRSPLIALALVGVSACLMTGTEASKDTHAFTSPDRPQQVRLLVRNMNFNDARLFALATSGRMPIGQVSGKQDREFELDWPLSSYMKIEIDMVAGPKCSTSEMQVDPGDILELQIASVFNQTQDCR